MSRYKVEYDSNPSGINESPTCNILEINNCPDVKCCKKLLSSFLLLQKYSHFKVFLFKVKTKITKVAEIKNITNEFVIAYESLADNKGVIHWKNENVEKIYKLYFLDKRFTLSIFSFAFDFITNAIINQKSVTSLTNKVNITSLIDSDNLNLFIYAAKVNNERVVRELLKFPFDINQEIEGNGNDDQMRAVDYIWKNKNHNLLLEFLQCNSLYPKDFDENLTTEEVRNFLKISIDLHSAIKNYKNKSDIEKFLTGNVNLRYFFNEKNVSAAKISLKIKSYLYYDLLMEHEVTLAAHETLDDIDDLERRSKKINDINANKVKFLRKRHIMILTAASVPSITDHSSKDRMKNIKDVYEILDSMKSIEIETIMKVAATSRKLRIIFDFTQDSTHQMSVMTDKFTKGETIFNLHRIIIGAKDLLEDKIKKNSTIAIVAHELTHYVMFLIFRNKCKPFAIGDAEKELEFKNILNIECERSKKEEELISVIFNKYPKTEHFQELIVRIPHMLVKYRNDKKSLDVKKATFSDLFKYFDTFIMPAMKNSIKFLEKYNDFGNDIKYSELTAEYKAIINNKEILFQRSKTTINKLTDENSDILCHLNSSHIREIIEGKSFSIQNVQEIKSEFYFEQFCIERNFGRKLFLKKIKMRELSAEAKLVQKDLQGISDEMEKSKIFILSNHAGWGKTECLKRLRYVLKEKNPHFWVFYIDLKNYSEIFKKIINIESINVLFEIFCKILMPKGKLEKEILFHQLKKNQIILLFDGFDEISPNYTEEVIKLIQSIKNLTEIQLCTSTRPHYELKLVNIFNCKIHNLRGFDSDEKKNFIQQYLKMKNYPKEDIDDAIIGIKEIRSKFIPGINTPLLLKWVTDLYLKEGKLTKNLSLCEFYEKIIEMKMEVMNEEKGKFPNHYKLLMCKFGLSRVLEVYALKLIFLNDTFEDVLNTQNNKKNMIDLNELTLFKKWKKFRKNEIWTADIIAKSGILTIDSYGNENEKPNFVHRSVAEYYSSKFCIDLIEEIFSENQMDEKEFEQNMKFLILIFHDKALKQNNYKIIYDFIFDYFKSNEFDFKFNHQIENFFKRKDFKVLFGKFLNNYKFALNIVEAINYFIKNESILEVLLIQQNDEISVFKIYFEENSNNSVENILKCFDILKSSNVQNWHKLTGYGKHLNKISFISEIEVNLEIEKLKFIDENRKILCKNVFQFLSFINEVNDIPVTSVRKFLTFSYNLIILHNSELFFKLFTKAFQNYFVNKKYDLVQNELNSLSSYGEIKSVFNRFFEVATSHKDLIQIYEFSNLDDQKFIFAKCFKECEEIYECLKNRKQNSNKFYILNKNNFDEIDFLKITDEYKFKDIQYLKNALDILKKSENSNLIELEMLKKFLRKHLSILFNFALQNESITNRIFKLLEIRFSERKEILSKIIKAFSNIFNEGCLSKKLIEKCIENPSKFDYFWSKLCEYFHNDKETLQKILLHEVPYYNPLILTINYNLKSIIDIYLNNLNRKEVQNIFILSAVPTIFLSSIKFNQQNLTSFIKIHFDEMKNFEFTECYENPHMNFSYIFLSLLHNIDCDREEIKTFFTSNFFYFLGQILFSVKLIDLLFSVLSKHYFEKQKLISEILVNAIEKMNFNKEFRSSDIEYFWSYILTFFENDSEFSNTFFTHNFKRNHPLSISAYYKCEQLQEILIKKYKDIGCLEEYYEQLKANKNHLERNLIKMLPSL